MSKVKTVVFSEEEDASVTSILEDLNEEEEIEKMFSYEPIKVEEVPKREDKVDVIPLRDYSFSFGGVWYYLTKGKSQTVPLAVRDFLLKNKLNPKIKDIW
jgi:hypothetical protein